MLPIICLQNADELKQFSVFLGQSLPVSMEEVCLRNNVGWLVAACFTFIVTAPVETTAST